jgi:hypothetical protein
MLTDDDDTLLDQNGAAEFLTMKPKTMGAWRVRGCGPRFLRIGRAIRYSLAQLKRYKAARDFGSTGEAEAALSR